MFPRLKERRRNLGGQLSGGEQQMLSTARTILGRPSVLLLDEPLEGLAPVICEELMAAFAELAKTGDMTILLVEQRIQSALDFAEHVIILERGRLAWKGTPDALARDHRCRRAPARCRGICHRTMTRQHIRSSAGAISFRLLDESRSRRRQWRRHGRVLAQRAS